MDTVEYANFTNCTHAVFLLYNNFWILKTSNFIKTEFIEDTIIVDISHVSPVLHLGPTHFTKRLWNRLSLKVFVSHFNYLYNLEKCECKLKAEELLYSEDGT